MPILEILLFYKKFSAYWVVSFRARTPLCGSDRIRSFVQCSSVSTAWHQRFPAVPLRIGADNVMPVSSVRDLSVYLDADVSCRHTFHELF